MTSVFASRVFPCFPRDLGHNNGVKVRIKCTLSGDETKVVYSDKAGVKGSLAVKKLGSRIGGGNGDLGSVVGGRECEELGPVKLEGLWDDGYGTVNVNDYLDISKEMIRSDGGPPRWFCPVECGCPLDDSPVLLFLPATGIDGVGIGLIMHHKALGKVFELRCMHIPVYDRTPFKGLVKFVEKAVRKEHASSPSKPIYLLGDSFGGCLALAVAARCPTIDLVLILSNPATSMRRSQLNPIIPIIAALPDNLHRILPYLLTPIVGDPLKLAMANVDTKLPLSSRLHQVIGNLISLSPRLSVVTDIIPKDTLVWKLDLLRTAADYTNCRLRAVQAEVLVIASGKDTLLPSENEAKRLSGVLKNCEFRTFRNNGHSLLLEEGINLLTVIKATDKYRRSKRLDNVIDFIPPSLQEYKHGFDKLTRFIQYCTSPVILSTLEDGEIVRGLAGVPNEGPVLLVGYHMLMGLELAGLYEAFLSEKKIMVRGLAHPQLFSMSFSNDLSYADYTKVFGATPVTSNNFFKLLSTKSHILLYPGGAREALHLKGEEYKLFWPDRPEFVRMAAKFGATIVPFGAVGEDDLVKLVLDYNDYMRIPVVRDVIRLMTSQMVRVRDGTEGEGGTENLYIPGVIPKVPGRFYYIFGKPIETRGKPELLTDKESAKELYTEIKSEIDSGIAYLLKKRKEDPYRSHVNRIMYRLLSNDYNLDIPSFSP